MRGVLDLSIYFPDATLASAFIARWCAGSSRSRSEEPPCPRRCSEREHSASEEKMDKDWAQQAAKTPVRTQLRRRMKPVGGLGQAEAQALRWRASRSREARSLQSARHRSYGRAKSLASRRPLLHVSLTY